MQITTGYKNGKGKVCRGTIHHNSGGIHTCYWAWCSGAYNAVGVLFVHMRLLVVGVVGGGSVIIVEVIVVVVIVVVIIVVVIVAIVIVVIVIVVIVIVVMVVVVMVVEPM